MKKNLVKGLVIGAMALGMAGMYGYGTEAATYRLGDVNLDGKVNLSDAQSTLRAALGISQLDGISKKTADINQDGKVNLGDAQLTLKVALGISSVDGTVSDEEEPTPSVKPSKAPEVTEEPKESEIPKVEPTESTQPVQTTTPAPQPTETTDDGIEGVDWKWETKWDMHTYCYCGELLDVDENGYLLTNEQVNERISKHCAESAERVNNEISKMHFSTVQEMIDAYNHLYKCGGWVNEYKTETYKVRLK